MPLLFAASASVPSVVEKSCPEAAVRHRQIPIPYSIGGQVKSSGPRDRVAKAPAAASKQQAFQVDLKIFLGVHYLASNVIHSAQSSLSLHHCLPPFLK